MAIMNGPQARPGLHDCRAAVHRIRATPDGRRALESLRPRGVSGVFRDRLPTVWLLYLGALEHRLVWQDIDGLALLEPPLARPEIWRQHRPGPIGMLRWVDAQWGMLLFVAPPAILLATSVVLGLLLGRPLAAVVVALAAMIYIVILMAIQVVWGLVGMRRETPEKNALGAVTADRWLIGLFHQENENRIDELLDRVRTRVEHLVRFEAEQAARDRGLEIDTRRLSAELAHPLVGVTTEAACRRVAQRFPIVHEGVSLGQSDRRPDDPQRRPYRPVRFVGWYFAGVVVVVAVIASFVVGFEQDACVPASCAAAPTTYPDALFWVFYRLVGVNAPGIIPTTPPALALGWLITGMGLTGLLVVVTGISRYVMRSRQITNNVEEQLKRGPTRLMLVTVADEECEAVLDAIERHTGRAVDPGFADLVPVYEMGQINDTEIFVVQAAQGVTNAGGAIMTTAAAIRQIDPQYALIVGMCYGLRPADQAIGDILVSEKILDLDPGKIVDRADGTPLEIPRGEHVRPSDLVVGAIRAARRGWNRTGSDVPVRVGPMLAWGKLVNSEPTVERLRDDYQDAIGADMEGAGFYAAARAGRVESVLIKGICDWGHGRDTDSDALELAKRTACQNSAAFVLHLVLSGVFARTPDDRVGR